MPSVEASKIASLALQETFERLVREHKIIIIRSIIESYSSGAVIETDAEFVPTLPDNIVGQVVTEQKAARDIKDLLESDPEASIEDLQNIINKSSDGSEVN